MRANHAHPATNEPAEPAAAAEPRPTRRPPGRAGRAGRPRPGTLAAGGAVLAAQVWGLGLGAVDAYAADAATPTGRSVRALGAHPGTGSAVSPVGRPGRAQRSADPATGGGPGPADRAEPGGGGVLGGLVGGDPVAGLGDAAGAAVERPTATVEQALQDRIRAGGLPLPGQAATVPDAFAIAAVLLPAVPAQQPRSEEADRASRSGTAGPGGRVTEVAAVPAQRAPGTPARTADGPGPGQSAPGPATPPDSPLDAEAPTADDLALAAAAPLPADDGDTPVAVLFPIAAGLLLTGAAMYKHRGLPGGH